MKFKNVFEFINEVAGIFVLWIIIHYISANLYARFCAELSIIGFIKSIFVAQAPHCIAMRWIIYNGGVIINSMWVSIAVWFTRKLLKNEI
jgi:hypothetical protein